MPKQRVLVLYDYFDPAYKAGGPIRSIVNMVKLLEEHIDFYILTTNQDHDGTDLAVEVDSWISYEKNARVFYMSPVERNYRRIREIISQVQPDTVYFNGIYSPYLTVYPLWILRKYKKCRIVIAPRGMLQKGALAIKAFKKRVYLAVLKRLISMNKVVWHVTNPQEARDLKSELPNANYIQLGNIPCYDVAFSIDKIRTTSTRRFGTVALISPMKNIHLILSAFQGLKHPAQYFLYGPVKDSEYWKKCEKLVENLPDNIEFNYWGDLKPTETSITIAEFDYYIQPSVSENFGHSIFEAFDAGVPVIISDKTPWKNLREREAGWDVNLSEPNVLQSAIEEAMSLNEADYLRLRRGARNIAENYMKEHDLVNLYINLLLGGDNWNPGVG